MPSPSAVHPALTAAEELRRGVLPEVSCDHVCHICAELLIVKEVQQQAPGCLAEECAAWSCEAEADTLVVSWISCCLVESIWGCADPGSKLL